MEMEMAMAMAMAMGKRGAVKFPSTWWPAWDTYEGGSQLYQQQPKARLATIIALQASAPKIRSSPVWRGRAEALWETALTQMAK
jgi:hypothetical protein